MCLWLVLETTMTFTLVLCFNTLQYMFSTFRWEKLKALALLAKIIGFAFNFWFEGIPWAHKRRFRDRPYVGLSMIVCLLWSLTAPTLRLVDAGGICHQWSAATDYWQLSMISECHQHHKEGKQSTEFGSSFNVYSPKLKMFMNIYGGI